ncbi:hypothetical protein V8C34DRAFT_291108 [Trichoderma compactum]
MRRETTLLAQSVGSLVWLSLLDLPRGDTALIKTYTRQNIEVESMITHRTTDGWLALFSWAETTLSAPSIHYV